jgi:hypothetical protein
LWIGLRIADRRFAQRQSNRQSGIADPHPVGNRQSATQSAIDNPKSAISNPIGNPKSTIRND